MRKLRVLALILSILVLFLTVTGCFSSSPNIVMPDKIIVFERGKETELTKKDELYREIFNLAANRLEETLDVAQLALEENFETTLKNNEVAVEFVYTSTQETTFKLSNSSKKIQYLRLLFPLTGINKDLMFYGDEDSYFNGPLGPLPEPVELKNLLS